MISHMTEEGGVKLLSRCEPMEVQKDREGKLLVSWFDSNKGAMFQEEWDTVLFATGKKCLMVSQHSFACIQWNLSLGLSKNDLIREVSTLRRWKMHYFYGTACIWFLNREVYILSMESPLKEVPLYCVSDCESL